MTRESLAGIPYGYREIYPEYHEFHECNYIITEDEDAGLEFYQHFYGEKVISSHGNSNLSKFGGPDCLLIGDGCAIGAFIQDLLLTKSAH